MSNTNNYLDTELAQEEKMQQDEKEMSFVDHLEVLRWHLIRSAASILVFAIAAFIAKDFVFHDLILGPSRPDFWTYRMLCSINEAICIDKLNFVLQSRQMSGQFTMHLMVSLIIGLICAFPYTFWEIWRFVKPGLYPQEQKNSRGAVFFVSILFITGLLFGYYVVCPLSVNFLASYQVDPSIQNQFDISSYVSTLATLLISCALMFELPVVVYFLSKAGLVSPEMMRVYRRHALVGILVVAAVITPPDVLSQVLVSIPLYALYEGSIFVSAVVRRRDLKRLNEHNT